MIDGVLKASALQSVKLNFIILSSRTMALPMVLLASLLGVQHKEGIVLGKSKRVGFLCPCTRHLVEFLLV